MPYCENCGSQVGSNAKFCGDCGAPLSQEAPAKPVIESKTPQNIHPVKPAWSTQTLSQRPRLNYYSPPNSNTLMSAPIPIMTPKTSIPAPPTSQVQPRIQQTTSIPVTQAQVGEVTVGVIVFRKMKSLGRYDAYAGVVTNQRLILAQLTSEMITAAATQARDQAKAEGKGFFGQWADQLRNTFGFTNRYLTMPHQAILAETPGNFDIPNNNINEVKIHLKGQNDDNARRELEAEIKGSSGTYKFRMDENSQFTDILKRVYGERLKMPFGYFHKSVNIRI